MLRKIDRTINKACRKQHWLFPIYKRVRTRQKRQLNRLISRDTDLVIDGFPRSGNSFAVRAFFLAQSSYVKVAHHHHAEAQVALGVKWKIPVMVPIRNPIDSVVSYSTYTQNDDLHGLMNRWISYHEGIWPFAHGIMLAHFERIITDFGSVINDLNQRFDCHFNCFEHTEKNVELCKSDIKDYFDRHYDDQGERDRKLTVPNQTKENSKAAIRERLESDESLRALGNQAQEIYERFSSGIPSKN